MLKEKYLKFNIKSSIVKTINNSFEEDENIKIQLEKEFLKRNELNSIPLYANSKGGMIKLSSSIVSAMLFGSGILWSINNGHSIIHLQTLLLVLMTIFSVLSIINLVSPTENKIEKLIKKCKYQLFLDMKATSNNLNNLKKIMGIDCYKALHYFYPEPTHNDLINFDLNMLEKYNKIKINIEEIKKIGSTF